MQEASIVAELELIRTCIFDFLGGSPRNHSDLVVWISVEAVWVREESDLPPEMGHIRSVVMALG